MAYGERQSLCGQTSIEIASGHRRLNNCDSSLAVKRYVSQAAKIDQQTVIAERKADPIMAAAAHRDFHPIGARKPDRLDYRILVGRLNDNARTPVRHKLIPYHRTPQSFVMTILGSRDSAGYAAPQLLQVHDRIPRLTSDFRAVPKQTLAAIRARSTAWS